MKKDDGYTLIELIISIALLSVIVISFYPIFISTNKVNKEAQRELEAKHIAQNQLEEIFFTARNSSQEDFNDNIFPDLIKQSRVNSNNYKKEIELKDEKILRIKVYHGDSLKYQTETWLVYE